jgi:hypothetical protein
MRAKALEIRDKGTFIPALAVSMVAEQGPSISADDTQQYTSQRYLLRRAGYNCNPESPFLVMLTSLYGGRRAEYDVFAWNDRTYHVAHDYITKHWVELRDGDVVDVEFILGETEKPKQSEAWHG